MRLANLLKKMQRDWDRRARENMRKYIATQRPDWTEEGFMESGRIAVEARYLTGVGTQDFWLWFFKRPQESVPLSRHSSSRLGCQQIDASGTQGVG